MTSPDHSTPNPARPIPKPDPDRAIGIEIQPASPRYPLTPSSSSPSSGASSALFATAHGGAAATAPHRKIGIPVDLRNKSAFAVRWAVQNYLRPGDAVTLIHVRPTSVLYGADWGSTPHSSAVAAAGEKNPDAEEGEEEEKTRMGVVILGFERFSRERIWEERDKWGKWGRREKKRGKWGNMIVIFEFEGGWSNEIHGLMNFHP